mmetsp:Transcript_29471/g.90349  ORF Transcript_29471/g.90349 Transcript_29471/m.90349 type:complete len:85 (+) Transcript_29471:595-849(+)
MFGASVLVVLRKEACMAIVGYLVHESQNANKQSLLVVRPSTQNDVIVRAPASVPACSGAQHIFLVPSSMCVHMWGNFARRKELN